MLSGGALSDRDDGDEDEDCEFCLAMALCAALVCEGARCGMTGLPSAPTRRAPLSRLEKLGSSDVGLLTWKYVDR